MKHIVVVALAFSLAAGAAKSDILGGFIGGSIDGAIIGGIIGGEEGMWDGVAIGGTIGAIDGAHREANRPRYHPQHRDQYVYTKPRRQAPAQGGQAMSARQLVLEVQRSLRRLGYNPGPADGVAGAATGRAILAYQKDQGLPQDNRINAALLNHMRQRGG